MNQQVACVDYLLKHGSNPTLRDDTSRTVMQLTAHLDIIVMLDTALELQVWKKMKRRPSNELLKGLCGIIILIILSN